ncbi:MAG: BlaI/MecI/CopY family transcriptional regulator [Phycisphaeraceae bacterium]|nr:BlaI/MecI/CopY family transcriptional regulator [Phycisphaeraceae bacterium]
MGKKAIDQLGELQAAILKAVWALERATVHEVKDQLSGTKELAYTTILTALQRLEKAGLVKHQRQGKSHVYQATNSREEAGTQSVQRLIKNVFQGNTLLMLQHLMDHENLSHEELSELRKMIDQKRKERKNG